ncbi:MAG TPA: dihydrolipoyllysine-residue acetyltransferase [Gammaproteobacteria bacterium]
MEVHVPDLGDFSDVEVIEILAAPGDRISEEDPLLVLETEKASMEVPSPVAGVVRELRVGVGDRVSTGDVIADVESDTKAVGSPDDPEGAAAPQPPEAAEEHVAPEPPQKATADPAAPETVVVPDLGDFADVEIIEVLVQSGAEVAAEQGLITLETEKASMEVPSPKPGKVLEVLVGVGDRVSAGDGIAVLLPAPSDARSLQTEAEAAPPVEPVEAATAARTTPSARSSPRAAPQAIDEAGFASAHASPSVRKLARELGVDLAGVAGTGHKGRITTDDLKAFVKRALRDGTGPALPVVASVDHAAFGPVDIEPLSRIQKIAGPRLHASWVNVPHVTQHDEADITSLEAKRQALKESAAAEGVRLTPLAFIVRACVLAIDEYPTFASSLSDDGESLVVKRYRHIGFAADTPNGLIVPVIRDADRLSVIEIAAELATLSERARTGKLGRDAMQGGAFTISSLGGIGGTAFTPIVNAPEVAILGVSRSRQRPVYVDGELQPRLILPLSLSYDHRVIDGALAVRFTTYLAELLGDVDRLVDDVL